MWGRSAGAGCPLRFVRRRSARAATHALRVVGSRRAADTPRPRLVTHRQCAAPGDARRRSSFGGEGSVTVGAAVGRPGRGRSALSRRCAAHVWQRAPTVGERSGDPCPASPPPRTPAATCLVLQDTHSTRAIAWIRKQSQPLLSRSSTKYELANALRFAEYRGALRPGNAATCWADFEADVTVGRVTTAPACMWRPPSTSAGSAFSPSIATRGVWRGRSDWVCHCSR